jgi:DNA-binding transcriptional ArsR family regulator
MKELEKTMKAFANRRRLAILKFLKSRTKPATVGAIAREIELSFKATSKHLGVLRAAEIIDREQTGLEMRYFIPVSQRAAASRIISLL